MAEAKIFKKQEMVKVAKLAKRWGVSRQHVYNLIDQGRIPAFRFGYSRAMFVPMPEIEKFEQASLIDPAA